MEKTQRGNDGDREKDLWMLENWERMRKTMNQLGATQQLIRLRDEMHKENV